MELDNNLETIKLFIFFTIFCNFGQIGDRPNRRPIMEKFFALEGGLDIDHIF